MTLPKVMRVVRHAMALRTAVPAKRALLHKKRHAAKAHKAKHHPWRAPKRMAV